MDRHKTGLAVGAFALLMHLVWVVCVVMNVAQGYLDWILRLHFLSNPYRVLPFDVATSAILLVFAAVMGYIVGFVFATLWNAVRG